MYNLTVVLPIQFPTVFKTREVAKSKKEPLTIEYSVILMIQSEHFTNIERVEKNILVDFLKNRVYDKLFDYFHFQKTEEKRSLSLSFLSHEIFKDLKGVLKFKLHDPGLVSVTIVDQNTTIAVEYKEPLDK